MSAVHSLDLLSCLAEAGRVLGIVLGLEDVVEVDQLLDTQDLVAMLHAETLVMASCGGEGLFVVLDNALGALVGVG